jgi:hypothetical protein
LNVKQFIQTKKSQAKNYAKQDCRSQGIKPKMKIQVKGQIFTDFRLNLSWSDFLHCDLTFGVDQLQ